MLFSDKRFGAIYPQFSICREYLREKIILERKNQKRLSASSSLNAEKKQHKQHKQHSMDILLEAVNKVIWGIFEDMEAFEYQYDESIQVDDLSSTLEQSWFLNWVGIRSIKLR